MHIYMDVMLHNMASYHYSNQHASVFADIAVFVQNYIIFSLMLCNQSVLSRDA